MKFPSLKMVEGLYYELSRNATVFTKVEQEQYWGDWGCLYTWHVFIVGGFGQSYIQEHLKYSLYDSSPDEETPRMEDCMKNDVGIAIQSIMTNINTGGNFLTSTQYRHDKRNY